MPIDPAELIAALRDPAVWADPDVRAAVRALMPEPVSAELVGEIMPEPVSAELVGEPFDADALKADVLASVRASAEHGPIGLSIDKRIGRHPDVRRVHGRD